LSGDKLTQIKKSERMEGQASYEENLGGVRSQIVEKKIREATGDQQTIRHRAQEKVLLIARVGRHC